MADGQIGPQDQITVHRRYKAGVAKRLDQIQEYATSIPAMREDLEELKLAVLELTQVVRQREQQNGQGHQ
jgi:hypothetical protein